MMVWNRKEVFVGNILQEFDEVCYKLASSSIKYDYKIVDSTSPSYFASSNRARTGTHGMKMDYTKTYYIHVYKNDYDKVLELLRNYRI